MLLLSVLLQENAFANDPVYLNVQDKAPFSGYLLPEDTVKELRNNTLERDSLQIQLDLTNKNNQLLTQEKQLLLDQNLKLIEAGTTDHNLNNWEKTGFFLAGILVTGLAIKGAANLRP